ncbi:MAG TPA: M20/M25/M40 family metallo-hydrolase [Blastocatellia bacterium]|nr:M20/M25/M40 family metallo-hydrolase [Blastocatellia bacterium]
MRRYHRCVLGLAPLLLLSAATLSLAQTPGRLDEISARIAGTILVNGHSLEYDRQLSDGFGGRLTGTDAYNRAAQWAADQFRAAGINNVKLEPFTILHGWDRGYARGEMIAPRRRPLHLESLAWTPSTPAGGVRGNIVFVNDVSAAKIKKDAGKINGNIAMLDLRAIFAARRMDAFSDFIASFKRLKEAGAAAALVSDREPNNVLNAFSPIWGTDIAPLPIAQVGMEDGELIIRLLQAGPVEIQFEYQNKVTGPEQVNDVVAEIPGTQKPDEWVIIGAHLDSWDFGTGAQDNGTGSAMVLEAARAIAALGKPPLRSIRFALWGGEEQGLLGSTAYVKAHRSELDRCVAVLNTDNGAGHPRGWKVEGRSDLAQAIAGYKSLLTDLDGAGVSEEASYDTDHGPFMLEGVPALDLWVDMTHYGEIHHKSSDTFDKVNAHDLADGAAVVAVTAYAVADRPDPIVPHLDHNAVEQILKKANVEDFLKAVGAWKD